MRLEHTFYMVDATETSKSGQTLIDNHIATPYIFRPGCILLCSNNSSSPCFRLYSKIN